jgi:very-short-patch-repair endonuclease
MSAPGRVPEVTRETGWQGPRGAAVHRSPLPEDELCEVAGVPATGLARTFVDLAAELPRPKLERALNEAEVQGLTDRLSIPDLLERYSRRSGTAVLRRLLAEERQTQGITRRQLEARFKRLLDHSDLPRPKLNAHVTTTNGRTFEVDCLWRPQGTIVELDGRATHGTRRAFERDREKDRLLQADGWRVVRVTWRQLRDDGPAVVADLRRTLRLAAPPTL